MSSGLRRDTGIQQAIIYEFNADKIICELVRLRKLHPDIVLPYITPHVFRHTFCTNLANAGMDVKNLQYLMGHSEVGVTLNVYTHANYDKVAEQLWKVVDFKSARRNAVSTPNLTPIGVKLA